jgi:hypothetical protein
MNSLPAHLIPVVQSAAGTIIGATIVAGFMGGLWLWWNAEHSSDRGLGLQIAGWAGLAAVIVTVLTFL